MKNNIAWAIILGLSIIIGSFLLGNQLYKSKKANSRVTVKGLSEREVTADQGFFAISSDISGNTSEDIQKSMKTGVSKIKNYFISKGFSEDDIKTENIRIYQNNYRDAVNRYGGNLRLSVTSSDIKKIKKASNDVTDILAQGILITGDKWSNGPKYYYTKFTEIKPEMIAEATTEAKKAAQEFAKTSGSSVGKIARANQGIFQILPIDRGQESAEFYSEKLIRVVTTVDYFLE